jgi:WD repeat-containing protein 7
VLTDPVGTKFGKGEEQRRSALENLKAVLSVLFTPGLNEEIDDICQRELHITFSTGSLGVLCVCPLSLVASCLTSSSGHFSVSLYNSKKARDSWCISSHLSAVRALSIVSAVRTYGLVEGNHPLFSACQKANAALDCMDQCNTVIAFYATSLRNFVGQAYRPPDLAYLARCWLNSCSM